LPAIFAQTDVLESRHQSRWGVERASEESFLLRRRGILFFVLGRVAKSAGDDASGLAHGVVDAILDDDGELDANTLRVLDDPPMSEDSLYFGLG
jgi:hypothetical protein